MCDGLQLLGWKLMRGHQEAYAPKVEGGVQVFWQDPLYEQGAHRFLLS